MHNGGGGCQRSPHMSRTCKGGGVVQHTPFVIFQYIYVFSALFIWGNVQTTLSTWEKCGKLVFVWEISTKTVLILSSYTRLPERGRGTDIL